MAHPWTFGHGFETKRGRKESPAAYEALTCYLELGANRSHKQVAAILGRHLSQLKTWSRNYSWKDRTAAYDAHQIQNRFKESRAENEAKHRAAILKFRDDQTRRARGMGQLAELLMELTQEKVEAMRAAGELPSEQQLSNLAKTVATLGETSMNLEAAALGVEELMEADLDA